MNLTFRFATLLCLSVLSAAAQGVCSEHTFRGKHVLSCDGYLTPAPGAGLAPVKILGTCLHMPNGRSTCETTMSLAGTILKQEVTGPFVLNSDCTGTVRYTQTLNGAPAPDLSIRFFVYDNGNQGKGMSTDAGTALVCKLDRLSIFAQ